jgi:hypothetical protein
MLETARSDILQHAGTPSHHGTERLKRWQPPGGAARGTQGEGWYFGESSKNGESPEACQPCLVRPLVGMRHRLRRQRINAKADSVRTIPVGSGIARM